MIYILIIIVLLVVAFKALPLVIAYFEKQHIRNDLEPREYDPQESPSEYLKSNMSEARELGFSYCGSYYTAPHASKVKAYTIFFRTPCGRSVIAFTATRFMGVDHKKAEVCTRFEDGTALITTSGVTQPDITNGIELKVLYEASLPELLVAHEARLEAIDKPVTLATDTSALALYEEIQVDRAKRLIAAGLARWVDPAQTTIRLTLKGARANAKATKRLEKQVVRSEQEKLADLEKALEEEFESEDDFDEDLFGLSPEQDEFLGQAVEEHNRNNEKLAQEWGFDDYERWGFDQKSGIFFIDRKDGSRVEGKGQIYGSYSPDAGTWEWAWNNPMVEEAIAADSQKIREYGEREGLDYLTAGIVPVPDEMGATYLAAVGEKVNNAQGVFGGATGPTKVFIGLKDLTRKDGSADAMSAEPV